MLPPSNPNPVTRNQSVPPLVRADSEILVGTQVGSLPLQQSFSSMVPPLSQLNTNSTSTSNNNNSMSLPGNISNMPSLLNNSLGSRGPVSGGRFAATLVNVQQQNSVGGPVDILGPAELDPPLHVLPSSSAQGKLIQNLSASQMALHHSPSEQLDGVQKFQRSFSMPHNQQQAQLKGGSGNISSVTPVKLEPRMGSSDQNGPPHNLPSSCGIGSIKLEQHPMPSVGGLGPVKLERQQSNTAVFLEQQQLPPQLQHLQQQQLLQRSWSPSQTAAAQISLLQQQKILQLQQQMLKNLPQQRNLLQRHLQHSTSVQSQVRPMLYEPGMCARRLTHFMYQQKQRPNDNNIEFWRKFVTEFFSPNAKKRWCVSCYGSGRQTNGVYPQDTWHCEICNHKPGRGFETTAEFLPRLFQIRYASGVLEELLYVDMPREYQNASGQIVLDYGKAVEESVLEQLRMVREGQLRIVFSPADLKICSWEFCARRHEELILRRLLMPQVSQLGAVVHKHQNFVQNSPSNVSNQDSESTCSLFMETARQLAKALEVPLINDLGYTKGFIRCLQISEVVNIMKDLIDYSRETGTRPMDSLINFPKRTSPFGANCSSVQQPEDQKMPLQSASNIQQTPACETGMPLSSASNGVMSTANSLSSIPPTSAPSTSVLLHQNTVSSRYDNQTSSAAEVHAGNSIQQPSANSNSLPTSRPNVSSSFPSPSSSALNNVTTSTSRNVSLLDSDQAPASTPTLSTRQPLTQAHESVPAETQSSVERILQEMMMSSQLNAASNVSNKFKGVNGITPAMNGGGYLVGSTMVSNSGASRTVVSLKPGLANAVTMNGQVRIPQTSQDQSPMNHQDPQDTGSNLLGHPDHMDSFDDLLLDWNSLP